MTILRKHREAIGWTMTDIKGLSLVIVQHWIHLNEEVKPKRDPQHRLNPIMQEVIRTEIVKLLDNGIIYPIFDSQWVSPVCDLYEIWFYRGREWKPRVSTNATPYKGSSLHWLSEVKCYHSQRPFSSFIYRSNAWTTSRPWVLLFLGWLLGVQPNPHSFRGPRENNVQVSMFGGKIENILKIGT